MGLLTEYLAIYEAKLELHSAKVEALRDLNEALGTRFTMNRLYDWRNPNSPRKLPEEVRQYLIGIMLPRYLKEEGINLPRHKVKKLVKKLS